MLVIAGHNGAGKTTCYDQYLARWLRDDLEHIDPDAIEQEIRAGYGRDPSEPFEFSRLAQHEAESLREMFLRQKISFSFESVFSDPVGAKLALLEQARDQGYFVVLLAVGLDSPERSLQRVQLRVARGGHPVAPEKIGARYPRVIANLRRAVRIASLAILVDNSEEAPSPGGSNYAPFAIFKDGALLASTELPAWWREG